MSTLFRYTTKRRHPHLAGQQNVLPRLRHRTVRRRNHQNRPVHLRRPGDHVLHIIGMPRAVDMRIMPLRRLILDMRRRNGDAPRPLLRRLVNLVISRIRRPARLRQNLGDRRRQRRLAMVDMPNRPNVAMRLVAVQTSLWPFRLFLLSDSRSPVRWPLSLERVRGIEPPSSAWKAVALPLSYTRLNPGRHASNFSDGLPRSAISCMRHAIRLP